jgi:hypothetical protein
VDFSLYEQIAPKHQPQIELAQAIDGLVQGMKRMGFSDANFRSSSFMRLKVLEQHMAENRLDETLHWSAGVAA